MNEVYVWRKTSAGIRWKQLITRVAQLWNAYFSIFHVLWAACDLIRHKIRFRALVRHWRRQD